MIQQGTKNTGSQSWELKSVPKNANIQMILFWAATQENAIRVCCRAALYTLKTKSLNVDEGREWCLQDSHGHWALSAGTSAAGEHQAAAHIQHSVFYSHRKQVMARVLSERRDQGIIKVGFRSRARFLSPGASPFQPWAGALEKQS